MNNQLILVGRAVRNPETREFETGRKVTKFSVAVKEFSAEEGKQLTLFCDVEAWNGVGDRVVACITKGREVVLAGRMGLSKYESTDKEGKKARVSKPVMKLQSFHMTGSKPKEEGDAEE